MIIHARVRFEFLKVSAVRLALEPPNLSVLCLVVDQELVVLFLREGGGLLASLTTHRPGPVPIGHALFPSAISGGRSAPLMAGRPYLLAEALFFAFSDILLPAVTAAKGEIAGSSGRPATKSADRLSEVADGHPTRPTIPQYVFKVVMETSAAKFIFAFVYALSTLQETNGVLNGETQKMISEANKNGPYLGLVTPNPFEMNPLLQSPSFTSSNLTIDFLGWKFRFGKIDEKDVILVMTGPGMMYGDGPEDELSLEADGDYTREIGYIKFANYATNVTECNLHDNFLNNVWYQPEEVFPIDGTPEERQHAFWVPVDSHYFELSKNLEVSLIIIIFSFFLIVQLHSSEYHLTLFKWYFNK
ncbi:hypothetical protein HYC85_023161 [Camellia sinensis]|uniref:Uncharacterized protein n=1 Tax=Camellia sinensis TaxID=4442 RepID=A0A7J7GDS4_CAMSI|nr:hypothetical protein HYC85_023161 [Camellia sinensis]